MPISLTCPTCDKAFRTADANAGKRGKCPGCGAAIQIPAAEEGGERVASDAQAVAAPRAAREPGSEGLPDLGDAPVEEPEATFSLPAFGLGALAAVCGAALWAIVLIKLQHEIGWIAWGLGWLIGTAVVKAGGRGVRMAAAAAVLALVSIGAGKWVGSGIMLDGARFDRDFAREVEQIIADTDTYPMYKETGEDAALWVAFDEPPSDAVLAQFMIDREYTEFETVGEVPPDELEWFRFDRAPWLEEFHAAPLSQEEWSKIWEADFRALMLEYRDEVSASELVIDGLELVDLVFAALGLATAWVLVMKARPARRRRRRPVRNAA